MMEVWRCPNNQYDISPANTGTWWDVLCCCCGGVEVSPNIHVVELRNVRVTGTSAVFKHLEVIWVDYEIKQMNRKQN